MKTIDIDSGLDLNCVQKHFITGSENSSCCESFADFILEPVRLMWQEYNDDGTKKYTHQECFSKSICTGGGGNPCGAACGILLGLIYLIYVIILFILLIIGMPIKLLVLCCEANAQENNIKVQKKILAANSTIKSDLDMAKFTNEKIRLEISSTTLLLEKERQNLIVQSQKETDCKLLLPNVPKSIMTETTKLLQNIQHNEKSAEENVIRYEALLKKLGQDEIACERNIQDLTMKYNKMHPD